MPSSLFCQILGPNFVDWKIIIIISLSNIKSAMPEAATEGLNKCPLREVPINWTDARRNSAYSSTWSKIFKKTHTTVIMDDSRMRVYIVKTVMHPCLNSSNQQRHEINEFISVIRG